MASHRRGRPAGEHALGFVAGAVDVVGGDGDLGPKETGPSGEVAPVGEAQERFGGVEVTGGRRPAGGRHVGVGHAGQHVGARLGLDQAPHEVVADGRRLVGPAGQGQRLDQPHLDPGPFIAVVDHRRRPAEVGGGGGQRAPLEGLVAGSRQEDTGSTPVAGLLGQIGGHLTVRARQARMG